MNNAIEEIRKEIAAQSNCLTVKDAPSNAVVTVKQRRLLQVLSEIERLRGELASTAMENFTQAEEIERLRTLALVLRERALREEIAAREGRDFFDQGWGP